MKAKKRKSGEKGGGGEGAIRLLPDDLLCHILSFLPTKEAVLTSVLSKRWRVLFTLTPNLDLDDESMSQECKRNSFLEFVDNRLLALPSNFTKFSLTCHNKGVVDQVFVEYWTLQALERGATDLSLVLPSGYSLPFSIFSHPKNLIKLKLGSGTIGLVKSFETHQGDFIFSHLKTLHLDNVDLSPDDPGFDLLLSRCPVLEELIMSCANLLHWEPVSSPTLKRLTIDCEHDLTSLHSVAQTEEYPPIDCSLTYYFGTWAPCRVSFDTPNLLYLNYSDFLASDYPLIKLDSLVEARLDVGLNGPDVHARDSGRDVELDATNLIMGIHNVQTLHISSDTLEVISDFCKTVPVFHNLNHLSIESNEDRGWQALPLLLINSPSLHTLVFHGLHHSLTDGCGDACDCIPPPAASCLSTCPVKILKILDFGATCGEMSLVEHFLKNLSQLEQVTIVLDFDSTLEEGLDLFEVSGALEIAPRASPNCKMMMMLLIVLDHSVFSGQSLILFACQLNCAFTMSSGNVEGRETIDDELASSLCSE